MRQQKNKVEKCPHCKRGQGHGGAICVRITSRIFVDWECSGCGFMYRTDSASGRYIGVSPFNKVHDENPV